MLELHHFRARSLHRLLELCKDPKVLAGIFRRFATPAVALHAPSAKNTWGVRAVLHQNEEKTNRKPLEFPAPVNIVGFHTVVTPATFGAFAVSSKDIDVAIDVDNQTLNTAQQGTTSTGGQTDGTLVCLESIGVLVPRLHFLWLDSPRPNLGFTFRSRYATAGASGLPGDVLITVDAFILPIGFSD